MNRRVMFLFAVILMIVLIGSLGNPVYAGGQNNNSSGEAKGDCDQTRDKDYVDEPKHQYCDQEATIDCDEEPIRQRLRDCDCDCPNDCLQERKGQQAQCGTDAGEVVANRARNSLQTCIGNLIRLRERVRACAQFDCIEDCLRERDQLRNEIHNELQYLFQLRLRLAQLIAE